mmetsp:Transcript_18372/g.50403  ORF Transcript_18372/g.50403 Transcript_18372/m.50403 type:complete len:234 (+) Transcript_18372:421-1122(+)
MQAQGADLAVAGTGRCTHWRRPIELHRSYLGRILCQLFMRLAAISLSASVVSEGQHRAKRCDHVQVVGLRRVLHNILRFLLQGLRVLCVCVFQCEQQDALPRFLRLRRTHGLHADVTATIRTAELTLPAGTLGALLHAGAHARRGRANALRGLCAHEVHRKHSAHDREHASHDDEHVASAATRRSRRGCSTFTLFLTVSLELGLHGRRAPLARLRANRGRRWWTQTGCAKMAT